MWVTQAIGILRGKDGARSGRHLLVCHTKNLVLFIPRGIGSCRWALSMEMIYRQHNAPKVVQI